MSPASSEVLSYTEGFPSTWTEDDSPESPPPTERESENVAPDDDMTPGTEDDSPESPPPTERESENVAPDDDMTQIVCDVIFEEIIGHKIIFACRSSLLSLETITHDMCQDVAATIMSTEWQKEIRRQIRLIHPQLK